LLSLAVPTQVVVDQSRAAATGEAPRPRAALSQGPLAACDAATPRLLLALLLDRAGAYKDAHWRLRTDFASELGRLPDERSGVIWRAAYPLAYRPLIAEAEAQSGLPEFFLQALAREESAFDAQVVSWAGAYGLTQLLVSTAREAGRTLKPPLVPTKGEELLDAAVSAKLGAASLALTAKRYKGNLALTLAAYNAGPDVASVWWKRHAKDGLDVLAEDMTIQETRGYVKRVLRTFGIYRWLYGGKPPELPIALDLPAS
jgi:soluble lytic murein transglycosylase